MHKATLLAAFVLVASPRPAPAAPAADAPPAGVRFNEAYGKMVAAEQARDARDRAAALTLFSKAVESHADFAADYPDWETAMVRFRIDYCRSQIQSLVRRIAQNAAENPDAADPAAPSRLREITAAARVMIESRQPQTAKALLLDGLRLNPDDRTVRLLMGIAQCEAGAFADAEYLLKPLVEEAPDEPLGHVALGTVYFALGRPDEAAQELTLAIGLDPDLADAHYNLAQILARSDPPNLAAARDHYQTAMDLHCPGDALLEAILSSDARK